MTNPKCYEVYRNDRGEIVVSRACSFCCVTKVFRLPVCKKVRCRTRMIPTAGVQRW